MNTNNLSVTVTANFATVAGTSNPRLCMQILRMVLDQNQRELEEAEALAKKEETPSPIGEQPEP